MTFLLLLRNPAGTSDPSPGGGGGDSGFSYLYVENLDPHDRFDQLELQLDSGDTAILRRGHRYALSATELRRARQFIVLVETETPPDEEPIGVWRLPVKGNPLDDDVPVWDFNEAAFVPIAATVVDGGGGPGEGTAFEGYFSVTSPPYNAPGDGVSDDRAAIQSALDDAAAAGGTVYFPPRTYRVFSTLNVSSGVTIELAPNATINHDFNGDLFSVLGSASSPRTLTANALNGSQTIAVSTTGLAVGQMGEIRSTVEFVTPDDPSIAREGEIVRISSIDSSGSLTIEKRLTRGYTTANGATFTPFGQLSDVTITGGKVVNFSNSTGKVIRATRARNVHVSEMRFLGHSNSCVSLLHCSDCRVARCEFLYGSSTAGYGVELFNGTRNTVINECRMIGGRHTVTTGGADEDIPVLDTLVSNCFAQSNASAGFDTHDFSVGMFYSGCMSVDCQSGFSVRGRRSIIQNFVVRNCNRGVRVFGGSDWSVIRNGVIDNITDDGTGIGQGVVLGVSSTGGSNDLQMENVTIMNTEGDAVWVDCDRSVITNLRIDSIAGSGVQYLSGTGHRLNGVMASNVTSAVRHELGVTIQSLKNVFNVTGVTNLYSRASGTVAAFVELSGDGSPEGVLGGSPGSTWIQKDADGGDVTWTKRTGTGSGGWQQNGHSSATTSTNNSVSLVNDSPSIIYHTGTLTTDRNVNLPTQESADSQVFKIARTGGNTGGPWGLLIKDAGGATIKSLAQGQWAEVAMIGTAWQVIGFGSL